MFLIKTFVGVLTFSLLVLGSAAPVLALSGAEEARVEAMLEALGQRKALIFIRNGSEHTATEAVSHLRLKLNNTKSRLETAEEFIDKAASKSSISGKPYMIKELGQEACQAGPFLLDLLKQTK